MAAEAPRALIADDEPLLRQSLARMLATAWPELRIVAEARNGREAIALFEAHAPEVCFLDVHMPGVDGIEAARAIGRRAHLVFVTAYADYAVAAFAQGALDYLVKPVEAARLADTVARLRERLLAPAPADLLARLDELASRLASRASPAPLRLLRASAGATVQLIPVEQVDFLHAEEKYTTIAWHTPEGTIREALVRTPLRELVRQLDAEAFSQVHRAYAVNLSAIDHVLRHDNDTAEIRLRNRPERIPVSRSYLHLFRQM